MTHDEIESLLGAFALHAVEPAEAAEIEEHLRGCPRCRAEVASHLETASLLGDAGSEAPAGLWDKIAQAISADDGAPAEAPPSPALGGLVDGGPPAAGARPAQERAGRSWAGPATWASVVAAAAAAAVIVLAVQVGSLHGQIGKLNTALSRSGLSGAVAQTALGPHRTIQLTSADPTQAATVIVAPTGIAFWVDSTLRTLPADETYQLWGLSHGKVVSLGLVGADPRAYAAFSLQAAVTRVMVTAEPQGGTPAPTTPVLVQGPTGSSV